jgi:hypothetical protein
MTEVELNKVTYVLVEMKVKAERLEKVENHENEMLRKRTAKRGC